MEKFNAKKVSTQIIKHVIRKGIANQIVPTYTMKIVELEFHALITIYDNYGKLISDSWIGERHDLDAFHSREHEFQFKVPRLIKALRQVVV